MQYSFSNSTPFGWPGLTGRAYNSKDDFAAASAAYFEVTDMGHGEVKTTLSDRVYYVIDGKGEFIINGKTELVEATDVIIVPKNTAYNYMATKGGLMKLFLVHSPAYDPEFEVKL